MKLTKRGETVKAFLQITLLVLVMGLCGSFEYSDAVALEKYDAKNKAIAVAHEESLLSSTSKPVHYSAKSKPQTLRQYAHSLVYKNNWNEHQYKCLVELWNRESRWNPNAHNRSSGAHGIPQALPASRMKTAGHDYYANGKTQIRWGIGYISGRYGSPCSALSFHNRNNWY